MGYYGEMNDDGKLITLSICVDACILFTCAGLPDQLDMDLY